MVRLCSIASWVCNCLAAALVILSALAAPSQLFADPGNWPECCQGFCTTWCAGQCGHYPPSTNNPVCFNNCYSNCIVWCNTNPESCGTQPSSPCGVGAGYCSPCVPKFLPYTTIPSDCWSGGTDSQGNDLPSCVVPNPMACHTCECGGWVREPELPPSAMNLIWCACKSPTDVVFLQP